MNASSEIQRALRLLLQGVPGLPTVAWDGQTFEPVPGSPWVRERIAWLSSEQITVGGGTDGIVSERFLYLLDVFYPRDGSLAALNTMVDAIRSRFRPSTRIAVLRGGYVQRAERADSRAEPGWLMVPITVRAYCYRDND